MSVEYREPQAGHYRLSQRVRITKHNGNSIAICDYPLRIVRLNPIVASVLTHCKAEQTPEELSQATQIPLKRIETLCHQLRWNGLLDAGPLLPPLDWPPISIVIPSYNRAKELERCLRSLLMLDYPADCLEMIVVDDASSDESQTMLLQLRQEAASYGIVICTLGHEKRLGAGMSRNTGTNEAHFDLIAYIDSDCVASPSWLKELVPAFQDANIGAVGGLMKAYDMNALLGRYEDVRSSLYMGAYSQRVSLNGPLTYLPTANLLVRRKIWQELAGFIPMAFGEDVDFCRRLLLSGSSILYIAKGAVYHDYRTQLKAFLKIHAAYASTEAMLLKRHPTERRTLLLPPEQAIFALFLIGGAWGILWLDMRSLLSGFQITSFVIALLPFIVVLLLSIFSTFTRLQKVKEYGNIIGLPIVAKATLRGHLAYTYHLSRHVTRYYTLPLVIASLFLPPVWILSCILCATVIVVDYIRLRPKMDIGSYAICSLLDDCSYEIGIVWGCIKYETWKPLIPVIKMQV